MVSKLPTSLSLMVATFHYRRGKVSQLHCLGREKEIGLEKGVMNTAYSAFEKWPLAYLRPKKHNKILLLEARLPQNDKNSLSLIIYSVLTQVT